MSVPTPVGIVLSPEHHLPGCHPERSEDLLFASLAVTLRPAPPLACHPERSELTHSPRASFARLP
jgi:hypothetical protein